MKLRLAAIAISVSGLLVSNLPPAAAEVISHWGHASSTAVVTVYDVTGSKDWNEALHRAISEWNAGTDHVEFRSGIGNADCEKGAGPYTVVVCIHAVGRGHAGEALTTSNDGHIKDVRIWLTPSTDQRWAVACHELGHALGLGHRRNSDTASCMTATPRSWHPDGVDFQTVTRNHAHTHR